MVRTRIKTRVQSIVLGLIAIPLAICFHQVVYDVLICNETGAGYDKITVNIYSKLITNCTYGSPTYIHNLCLKQGIFPNKLKQAIVKPLYKLGNKENMSNYNLYRNCLISEKIRKNSEKQTNFFLRKK